LITAWHRPHQGPAAANVAPKNNTPPVEQPYDYNKEADWKKYVSPDGLVRKPRGRFEV
jgi:hypothetical protein